MNVTNMSLARLSVGRYGLVDSETGKVLVEINNIFGTSTYRVGGDIYINLSFAERAAREIVRKRL